MNNSILFGVFINACSLASLVYFYFSNLLGQIANFAISNAKLIEDKVVINYLR